MTEKAVQEIAKLAENQVKVQEINGVHYHIKKDRYTLANIPDGTIIL